MIAVAAYGLVAEEAVRSLDGQFGMSFVTVVTVILEPEP
jgi:hypothetical protein